jgi:nickel/cobalt exporter
MDIGAAILVGPAGALLGFRHAFEPDHIAALSALSTGKLSRLRACFVGAAWGVGHSCALCLVAFLLITFASNLDEQLQRVLDILVGVSLLWCAWRAGREILSRTQNEAHTLNSKQLATPFLIGILHGLAGSGALFVIAATRSEGGILTSLLLTCFSVALIIATAGISIGFSLSQGSSIWLSRAARAVSVGLNSFLGLKLLTQTLS